ncbi:TIGR03943 family protein [Homoserinibacter sp. GY 40078]|nr:TIGR03943 family protein [Homoserinibacter sp. GY 40078]
MLSLIGVAGITWLAATGRLGLYIHPRYFVFTIVMAVIAGVVAIVAFAVLPSSREGAHDDHDHAPLSPTRQRWATGGTLALIAVTAVVVLALPPATLTSNTAEQRSVNASATSGDASPQLAGADTSAFTVKDWANMLRQGADAASLAGESPTLVGFVTPDPDDPENVFFVARFVVTCCAVDATPVGVPVYLPGWQDDHPVDGWVEVTGRFIENPSATSAEVVVVDPASVDAVEEPTDPYVY